LADAEIMSHAEHHAEKVAKEEADNELQGAINEEDEEVKVAIKKKQDTLIDNKVKLKEIKRTVKEA